jgi:hypothetical protein
MQWQIVSQPRWIPINVTRCPESKIHSFLVMVYEKYHSINFQISNSNVSENEDLTNSNYEFWQIHWEHMLTNQWVSAARGPLFVSSASHTGPRERPRYLTRSSDISWMAGCVSVCFRVIIQWNAQIYTEYAPVIILCYGYYESWSTY